MVEEAPRESSRSAELIVQGLHAKVALVKNFVRNARAIPPSVKPEDFLHAQQIKAFEELSSEDRRRVEDDPTRPELTRVLSGIAKNLANKREEVVKLQNNLDSIFRVLADARDPFYRTFQLRDVVSIDTNDPFSIVLTVEPPEPGDQYGLPVTYGAHLSRTPLCFVYKDAPFPLVIAEHERLHNALENALADEHPAGHFAADLAVYKFHPKVRGAHLFNAQSYINDLHTELALSAEYAARVRFAHRYSRVPKDVGATYDTDRYELAFATAGVQLRELKYAIRNERDALATDPALREILDKLLAHIDAEFRRVARNIEGAFEIIEQLPAPEREEAHADLFILMWLLKPEKFQHLTSYFRYVKK